MLSAQNQIWRTTGRNIGSKQIKELDLSAPKLFDDKHIQLAINSNLTIINVLNQQIESIEKTR